VYPKKKIDSSKSIKIDSSKRVIKTNAIMSIMEGGFLENTVLQERRVELEKFLQCIKGNRKMGEALCEVRTIEYDEDGEPIKWNGNDNVMNLFNKMIDRIFSGEQKVNGKTKQWNNGGFGSRWYDDRNTYMTCRVAFYSKKMDQKLRISKAYALHFTFEPRSESTCGECKKEDYGYKKCSACNVIRYCSKECQRKHWKNHKDQCKAWQKEDEEEEEEEDE